MKKNKPKGFFFVGAPATIGSARFCADSRVSAFFGSVDPGRIYLKKILKRG